MKDMRYQVNDEIGAIASFTFLSDARMFKKAIDKTAIETEYKIWDTQEDREIIVELTYESANQQKIKSQERNMQINLL